MGSHELVDLEQELLSDHGWGNEGKQSPSHVLVSGAMNGCNVAFAQNVKHRLRIARNKAFRLVHEDVSVELRIHRNYGWTPKYVGFENTTVPVFFFFFFFFFFFLDFYTDKGKKRKRKRKVFQMRKLTDAA